MADYTGHNSYNEFIAVAYNNSNEPYALCVWKEGDTLKGGRFYKGKWDNVRDLGWCSYGYTDKPRIVFDCSNTGHVAWLQADNNGDTHLCTTSFVPGKGWGEAEPLALNTDYFTITGLADENSTMRMAVLAREYKEGRLDFFFVTDQGAIAGEQTISDKFTQRSNASMIRGTGNNLLVCWTEHLEYFFYTYAQKYKNNEWQEKEMLNAYPIEEPVWDPEWDVYAKIRPSLAVDSYGFYLVLLPAIFENWMSYMDAYHDTGSYFDRMFIAGIPYFYTSTMFAAIHDDTNVAVWCESQMFDHYTTIGTATSNYAIEWERGTDLGLECNAISQGEKIEKFFAGKEEKLMFLFSSKVYEDDTTVQLRFSVFE